LNYGIVSAYTVTNFPLEINSIAVINPEIPAPITAADGLVEGSTNILKDFDIKKAAP